MDVPGQSPSRLWATLSLIAGGLWLMLSVLPTMVTTFIGLPFAALAFGLGGWSLLAARRSRDGVGERRANWAIGLSCLGCVWQVVALTLLSGALLASVPALLHYLQGTPTPP